MWWRRSWFSLNGTIGIHGQKRGRSPTPLSSSAPANRSVHHAVKGRKRHIVTDTLGLMLFVLVHGADVPDRDGAPALLKAIRHRFPWLRHLFATSSPMAATLATSCALRSRATATGPLRSSSDPTLPRASSFYRAGGLLNEPSPGLAAAGISLRTGRQPSRAPPHGHSSPASG